MNSSTLNFLVGAICGGIIGNGAFWLMLLIIKVGRKEAMPTLRTFWRLSRILNSVQMIAFNRCRDDYLHSHTLAGSAATYASHAKRELAIVSITLESGINFDGLCNILRDMLERESPVLVTISLLNPSRQYLMQSLCEGHEVDATIMAKRIIDNLTRLIDFKKKLSQRAQDSLKIRIHNTLPMASAIMVDCDEIDGRIQLETKAYKAHYRKSFGFELKNGGIHPMYAGLVESYRKLIGDGENYAAA